MRRKPGNTIEHAAATASHTRVPPAPHDVTRLLQAWSDGDEAARVKTGRIWDGGRSRVEQPFALILNPDQQFARVAAQIAHRVNEVTYRSAI